MNLATATKIVLQMQNEYLRGEMTPEMIQKIREEYPQAIPDWNKMLLNLKVKQKNLNLKREKLFDQNIVSFFSLRSAFRHFFFYCGYALLLQQAGRYGCFEQSEAM